MTDRTAPSSATAVVTPVLPEGPAREPTPVRRPTSPAPAAGSTAAAGAAPVAPAAPPPRILLSPPDMSERERTLLLDAFDANWVAPAGPELERFEAAVCERTGVAAAVALSSGTAALHLALELVGVGPGDDVIVPTLTFVATANAAVYTGARPCFVDVDTTSWNLDPRLLEVELTERARTGRQAAAVVAVDLYGQCADYDEISRICSDHGVPLVEDAAEALGARHRSGAAGSFGSAGVFSFNGNKILTSGGGGMLVSDDVELVARARHLATQARQPVAHYEHEDVGYNYRLSNLLAAVGRGQLERLDELLERRRAVHRRYREGLADVEGIEFAPRAPWGDPNHWLTVVRLRPQLYGATRDEVLTALGARGIEARPAWKPMHLQPVFAHHPFRGGSVAEAVFVEGLCLPSGSALDPADQDEVIEILRGRRG